MAVIAKMYDGHVSYSVQKADDTIKKFSEENGDKAEYYTDTEHGLIYFSRPNKNFEGVTKNNYKKVFIIDGLLYVASEPGMYYSAIRKCYEQ